MDHIADPRCRSSGTVKARTRLANPIGFDQPNVDGAEDLGRLTRDSLGTRDGFTNGASIEVPTELVALRLLPVFPIGKSHDITATEGLQAMFLRSHVLVSHLSELKQLSSGVIDEVIRVRRQSREERR